MFALVESGSITKFFSGNRGITIGDKQYPKEIFTLWTKSEREAIGIYEVEMDNSKRINYGFSIHNEFIKLNLSQFYEFTENSNYHNEQGNDDKLSDLLILAVFIV